MTADPLRATATANQENSVVAGDRKRPAPAPHGTKRARVPFGGKDSNQPLLQRAKTALAAALGAPARALPRSRSSLGLSSAPGAQREHKSHTHETRLSAAGAARDAQLVPPLASDQLRKRSAPPLPRLAAALSDTLLAHTTFDPPVAAPAAAEPTKHAAAAVERLAQDPHSIELVPARSEPMRDDMGLPTLSPEDLAFIGSDASASLDRGPRVDVPLMSGEELEALLEM